MKYAQSLTRQGELFDATAANYHSFKNLLLNCPHCRGSVYLVKSHSRIAAPRKLKSGREVAVAGCEIPAFFSHHYQEESIECENYNRSLNDKSIDKALSVARNQRIEIFRDRFIEIFLTASSLGMFKGEPAPFVRKSIADIRKKGVFFCSIPATLFAPDTPIRFSAKAVEPAIEHCVKFPYRTWGRARLVEEVLPNLIEDEIPANDRIGDDATQVKYVTEALDFLFVPTQRKLLTEIFWILIFEIAGSICWGQGQQIMSSPTKMGMHADRQERLAGLPKFLQETLMEGLTKPLYRYTSKAEDDPYHEVDSGIRLPLTLLSTCLLTIDWETEFTTQN